MTGNWKFVVESYINGEILYSGIDVGKVQETVNNYPNNCTMYSLIKGEHEDSITILKFRANGKHHSQDQIQIPSGMLEKLLED